MPFKKGKNVKQTKITDTMGIKTKKAQASPKLKQDINLQENVTDKKILEEKILGLKSIISNFDANNKETNEKVCNLPVSFETFKRLTFHNDVIANICQSIKELEYELPISNISKEELFDNNKLLRSYYKTFYMQTVIRTIFPLKIKPCPGRFKDDILKYPEITSDHEEPTVSNRDVINANTKEHLNKKTKLGNSKKGKNMEKCSLALEIKAAKDVTVVERIDHDNAVEKSMIHQQPHKRQSGIEIISIEMIVPPNIENEITLDEQSPVIPEENMEIFNKLFDPIPLKCTLSYVLRFSFGPKQSVLRTLMHISFEDFCKFTNIYQLSNIYNDKLKLFKIYESTIKKEIWPFNLYMRISDIFLYLLLNDVKLDLSDLQHISPKFLHWSDLAVNTNFNEIVQDYFNMNGKRIDGDEQLQISRESFYTRCWNDDGWIWKIPKITNNSIQEMLIKVTKALSDEDAEQWTVEKKNVKGSYISPEKYLNENSEYHNHTELVETSSSITNRSLKITDNASTIC
ncbi:uncharacterized protein LOC119682773 isoform X2 [Teleopsis dalmanni]|uniref:uncharacterized protein LOC119682773 isoform X2 n=1 Tax=Teleopsis dalmanni TaxID=139649 RepID=UPI0018CFC48D|nr:uncharacterized protein LOC119682773 isoform X2 [Teleopsis dalmanni]